MASSTSSTSKPRQRLRQLLPNIHLGNWPPGPLNGITDVPGVLTHTITLQPPSNPSINTGLTVILPHKGWIRQAVHAGFFRFNGAGEMTGAQWIDEAGLLNSPIVLTSTISIGDAHRGIFEYLFRQQKPGDEHLGYFIVPVVAETFDGVLHDISSFAVKPEMVGQGIENATADLTPEGCTGGGTGMICQGFKAGTGTSSRVVKGFGLPDADGNAQPRDYTVGVLVQANYGRIRDFRVAGVPVGRIIVDQREKEGDAATLAQQAQIEEAKDKKDGSIIIIIATDAPLHPVQLQRIARRATVGLARVGGYGHNPSGDLFLAFSTANKVFIQSMSTKNKNVDAFKPRPLSAEFTDDQSINGLFEAAADATEEAIYNAICMAETTVGHQGQKVDAIDLDQLKGILEKYT
ncbi:hypothetical protein VPNG_07159 [Cytospora leucostoma]|uniref:Peptidase S58 DmpA n=1 Tax=Cytospora leucostoma TaxID=1230097 RepID=A0A423WK20_9PEZI|nr:hypothetical protein VPNG_07159 [Cytospora leucostoma]